MPSLMFTCLVTCPQVRYSPAHDLNVVKGEQGQYLQNKKEKLLPHHPISE